jgi:general secretion pathway protein I
LHRAARSEPADSGFTLVEVLVALAIVGITLAAIGRVIATTSHGVRALEQRVSEVEILRGLAAGLSSRSGIAAGSRAGETAGQRWRIDIAPWAGDGVDTMANSPWVAQAVTIRVQSAAGAVLGVETVRLVKRTN